MGLSFQEGQMLPQLGGSRREPLEVGFCPQMSSFRGNLCTLNTCCKFISFHLVIYVIMQKCNVYIQLVRNNCFILPTVPLLQVVRLHQCV